MAGSACATVEEFRARMLANNYEEVPGNAEFVNRNIRESSEIRSWIAKNFASIGESAGTDVMRAIISLAPEHVFPEFDGLIRSLLDSDYFCAPAIMCLSHYDIPGRRDILRDLLSGKPLSCEGAEWFAVAAHLDAYGEVGIEPALERALAEKGSKKDQLSMAGMIAVRATGVWRDRAWERINGLIEWGAGDRWPALTAKVLDDAAEAASCGTEQTAELVRHLSQNDRDGLAEAAERFEAACLHQTSPGE